MKKDDSASPTAGGVYVALATPRLQNAVEADAAALFEYVDTIVAAGVNGLVLFGSTGEFVHFDLPERTRILTLIQKRCRVPLLVNVSHSSLAGAIELAEDAVETGVSGLLLMPPYYFRYSAGQIAEFFRQFARIIAGKTRLYLYNIPQCTNPIPIEAMEEMLAGGSYAGIKDSSGDWPLFEHLYELRAKSPFTLFVGNDAIYRRARPLGADGIISGIAAALPELVVGLEAALRDEDNAHANLLDVRLHEFIQWVERFPATIAIKQAAVGRGWKLDHSAVPFDQTTVQELQAFHDWFKDWLPQVLTESSLVRS